MLLRTCRTAVLVASLSLAACSVSTPRHEAVGTVGASPTGNGTDAPMGGSLAAGASPGGQAVTGSGVTGDGAGPAGGAAGSPGATGSTEGGGVAPDAGAPAGAGAAPGLASPSPGVSDEAIVVSVIAGFSGVLAPVVEVAYTGLETAIDDINSNGGIHGRQVILKRVDHKETADGGIAACKEAASNGSFVALVPEGVEANVTAVSCLDAIGMPTLFFSAVIDPAWRFAFSDVATSAQAGVALGSYVANRLGAAGRNVGVIYVNQLAYQATAETFIAEAGELGLNVVGSEPIEPNQASFTSQLLRLRNAGAEVVMISATAEAIGILRDATVLNWQPQFTGWGFAFDFITAAGRDLFTGVRTVRGYATVDTPAYEAYAARMEANGRGRSRNTDTEAFLAYGHGLMLGEMLTRAGTQPTWASFVAGSETIQNYDNGVLPPITYGPGDHVGTESVFPIECCSSDWTWHGTGPAAPRY